MAILYQTRWTKKGAEKIQNALLTESRLKITHMVIGGVTAAGTHPPQLDDFAQNLPNEIYEIPVQHIEQDDYNANRILFVGVIPHTLEGGYYLNIAGLLDEDGDLVAQATLPESYKPLLTENASKNLEIRLGMITATPQALSMELNVDRYVTASDVETAVIAVLPEMIKSELGKRDLVERPELDEAMRVLKETLFDTLEEDYWSKDNQKAVFLTRERAADYGIDQDLGSTKGNNNLDYDNVDLNHIIKAGEYRFDSRAKNSPCPNGLLKVWRSDSTSVCQIVQDLGSDPTDPNAGSLYSRSMYLNSQWTEWTGTRKAISDFIEEFLHVGSWHGTHNMQYDPAVNLSKFFGYPTSWMLLEGIQQGVSKDAPTDMYLGNLGEEGASRTKLTSSRIWKRLANNAQPPEYALRIVPDESPLLENKQYRVILDTANVPEGKVIPWESTGTIETSDIEGGPMSGNFVVGAGGIAFFDFKVTDDMKEEGNEFWSIFLSQDPTIKLDLTISDSSFIPTAQSFISATKEDHLTPLVKIYEGQTFWLTVIAKIPFSSQNNKLFVNYPNGQATLETYPTEIVSISSAETKYQFPIKLKDDAVGSGIPFVPLMVNIDFVDAYGQPPRTLSTSQIIIQNTEIVDIWKNSTLVWKKEDKQGGEETITTGEFYRPATSAATIGGAILHLELYLPYAVQGTTVYIGTWTSGEKLGTWLYPHQSDQMDDKPHPTLPGVRYRVIAVKIGPDQRARCPVFVEQNSLAKTVTAARGFATFEEGDPVELEKIIFTEAAKTSDLRVNRSNSTQPETIWLHQGANHTGVTLLAEEYEFSTGFSPMEDDLPKYVTFGVKEGQWLDAHFPAEDTMPPQWRCAVDFGDWPAGSEVNLINYGTLKAADGKPGNKAGVVFAASENQRTRAGGGSNTSITEARLMEFKVQPGEVAKIALLAGGGGGGGSVYSPAWTNPDGTRGGNSSIVVKHKNESTGALETKGFLKALGGEPGHGGVWGNGSSFHNGWEGAGGTFEYSSLWADAGFSDLEVRTGKTPSVNIDDRWSKAPPGITKFPYWVVPKLAYTHIFNDTHTADTPTQTNGHIRPGQEMDFFLVGAGAGGAATAPTPSTLPRFQGTDGGPSTLTLNLLPKPAIFSAGGGKIPAPVENVAFRVGGKGGKCSRPDPDVVYPAGVTVQIISEENGNDAVVETSASSFYTRQEGGLPRPLGEERRCGEGGRGCTGSSYIANWMAQAGGGGGARMRVRIKNESGTSIPFTLLTGIRGRGTDYGDLRLQANNGTQGAFGYGGRYNYTDRAMSGVTTGSGDGGRGIGDEYLAFGGPGGAGGEIYVVYENKKTNEAIIQVELGPRGRGWKYSGNYGQDGLPACIVYEVYSSMADFNASAFNFGTIVRGDGRDNTKSEIVEGQIAFAEMLGGKTE